MARCPNLTQIRQLVDIRRSERQLAENDVFEARHGENRAKEILALVEADRELALAGWQSCQENEYIDLGLEPNLAKQLIVQEERVRQSSELLSISSDRLKRKQARWRQSDLCLRAVEKQQKTAARRAQSKRDERQLAETTDRHGFRRMHNDR